MSRSLHGDSGTALLYFTVVNNMLEIIWKKEVMFYFKIPTQHLSGGTEKNHDKPNSPEP
jgi:hypothetical protein